MLDVVVENGTFSEKLKLYKGKRARSSVCIGSGWFSEDVSVEGEEADDESSADWARRFPAITRLLGGTADVGTLDGVKSSELLCLFDLLDDSGSGIFPAFAKSFRTSLTPCSV